MPPKAVDLDAIPADAILPLQDWLKLLSGRGVEMRVAMTLAAKIHNTKERLSKLDAKKLTTHLPDKEQRRSVVNAVKGIASGQSKAKKRNKDSDLMQPLPTSAEVDTPASLEIKEILDPEVLIPVSITTNRAPVKTAWAFVVCERLGFDRQEALSIAHVFVHFSSLKHALMLGNILNKQETREAEEEMSELPDGAKWVKKKPEAQWTSRKRGREEEKETEAMQSSQPWVGLLRANPVIERPDGTWRAIEKGLAVQPSQAFLYFTKAFKDYTPHVIGAMRLVANSYDAEELNRFGMGMYNEFKPDVVEWGQKGFLQCSKILDQAKGPVDVIASEGPPDDLDVGPSRPAVKPVRSGADLEGDLEEEVGSPVSDHPEIEKRELKKAKVEAAGMTVEEYEAMLDAEAEDGEGGFLEAGGIPEADGQAS